ncbi:hypothetical protein [Sphingomonas phyllosphaerae]|uniref:hypothetical protein n=1 Tax=Sphingomonas phyllosphaerae TaxID=257003 RepID=UPI0003F92D66|nr:hypothetical protein [Sphingomonas phyllosphaerae]
MTDTPTAAAVAVAPSARVSWPAIASLVISTMTLLITIATVVFYGGQLTQRVDDGKQRTLQLEARVDRMDVNARDSDRLLASLGAKLDLLIARSSRP